MRSTQVASIMISMCLSLNLIAADKLAGQQSNKNPNQHKNILNGGPKPNDSIAKKRIKKKVSDGVYIHKVTEFLRQNPGELTIGQIFQLEKIAPQAGILSTRLAKEGRRRSQQVKVLKKEKIKEVIKNPRYWRWYLEQHCLNKPPAVIKKTRLALKNIIGEKSSIKVASDSELRDLKRISSIIITAPDAQAIKGYTTITWDLLDEGTLLTQVINADRVFWAPKHCDFDSYRAVIKELSNRSALFRNHRLLPLSLKQLKGL